MAKLVDATDLIGLSLGMETYQGMEGQRPLVSPPVKNYGLTMNSQYAFISCLSSFMVRYSGVLGVEEPHQSIPNLVVKLYCGDDTIQEVLWKNSSAPG
ncbi:hypothetical protein HN873_012605 [Arachis hypogaea]